MRHCMAFGKLILTISVVGACWPDDKGAVEFGRGIRGPPGETGPQGYRGEEGVSCGIGRKRRNNYQLPSIEDPQKHPIGPKPLARVARQQDSREICAPGCLRGFTGPKGANGLPGIEGPSGKRSSSSRRPNGPARRLQPRSLLLSRAKRMPLGEVQRNSVARRQASSDRGCEKIPACEGPAGPAGDAGPNGPPGLPCYLPD